MSPVCKIQLLFCLDVLNKSYKAVRGVVLQVVGLDGLFRSIQNLSVMKVQEDGGGEMPSVAPCVLFSP